VTDHCDAAPALLIRGYQGDHHRLRLTSVLAPAHSLDPPFHIRCSSHRPCWQREGPLTTVWVVAIQIVEGPSCGMLDPDPG